VSCIIKGPWCVLCSARQPNRCEMEQVSCQLVVVRSSSVDVNWVNYEGKMILQMKTWVNLETYSDVLMQMSNSENWIRDVVVFSLLQSVVLCSDSVSNDRIYTSAIILASEKILRREDINELPNDFIPMKAIQIFLKSFFGNKNASGFVNISSHWKCHTSTLAQLGAHIYQGLKVHVSPGRRSFG